MDDDGGMTTQHYDQGEAPEEKKTPEQRKNECFQFGVKHFHSCTIFRVDDGEGGIPGQSEDKEKVEKLLGGNSHDCCL